MIGLQDLFLLGLLAASIFATAASSLSSKPFDLLDRRQESVYASPTVCTTSRCQEYANFVRSALSPNYKTMSPCDDFDKYACDGWRASHNYRPEQDRISVGSRMYDTNTALLRQILEEEYKDNTTYAGNKKPFDRENFQTMKTLYKSCMNEDAIKAVGVVPLRNLLDEFQTIYLLNGSNGTRNSSSDELVHATSWLHKHNASPFVTTMIQADDKDPNATIIFIAGPSMTLTKEYYNRTNILANYTRAIAEMIHVVSTGKPIDKQPIDNQNRASLLEKAQRVVDFEKLLAKYKANATQADDLEYWYNSKTLGELESIMPDISITKYLKTLAASSYSLDTTRKIIVKDIAFYAKLSNIIRSTSRQTLYDYFQWKIIQAWAPQLHWSYNTPLQHFNNLRAGKDADAIPERWRTCLRKVDEALGYMLGATFVQRCFTQKDKELGNEIIRHVRNGFIEGFKNLDWMTETTKSRAARKAANILQMVGYQTENPNEQDPEQVSRYYAPLPITKDFFRNGLASFQFKEARNWERLLKPTDRQRFHKTSTTLNAYYDPPGNTIVFLAGIMQPPAFSGSLPEYVSYGAFGSTVGHELTHAFDNEGAKYDEYGSYRDWWDNSTMSRFEGKTQCFIKQYEKYSVEGHDGERVPLNGKLTLGENIADAGGLIAAYRAWKRQDTLSPNSGLPGLEEFTNEQLFFLSSANSGCEKQLKEPKLRQVYSNVHSPGEFRTLGPLDNSIDFKKAFNCPVKKPTCELW